MSAVPACVIAQSKDVGASSKALHSIPSKIEYTGPANIDGCFIVEKGDDGTLRAAFRGRGLEGCEMPLPEGFEAYVVKERLNSANTETRRFDIVDQASSFTFWEWDREAGANSQPSRAFSSLRVAQALATDD